MYPNIKIKNRSRTISELHIILEHISEHGVEMMFVEVVVVGVDCVDDLDTGVGVSDSLEEEDVIIHLEVPWPSEGVLSRLFCAEVSGQTHSG